MDRRRFNTLCSGLLAGAVSVQANETPPMTPQPATRLLWPDDTPITIDSLSRGQAYVFGYPYRTTPCFLIRLNGAAPPSGSWPGGLGADQSVVAFSAICTHKMSHPAKPISHIAFRGEPVSFHDSLGRLQSRQDIISCCSERSVYDPAKGGRVLSGPAPAPLATIVLEADDQGQLSAIGSMGLNQYDQFLDKFGFRLAMEYGVTDVRARSGETAQAIEAELFSVQQVLC